MPPLSPPPVTVALLGQKHSDAAWLKELDAKIEDLHRQKKPLVLCMEQGSDFEIGKAIAAKTKAAAVGAYFDEVESKNIEPTLEGFQEAVGELVENERKAGMNALFVGSEDYLQQQFEAAKTDRPRHRGRTEAYAAEAALLQHAQQAGIPAVGIDAFTNQQKQNRYSNPPTDQELAADEYTRINHMGGKLAEQVQALSVSGGCVIGVNLGASHVASLERMLSNKLGEMDHQHQTNLSQQAKITVCVSAANTQEAKQMISNSPQEIAQASQIDDPEEHAESINELTTNIQQLQDLHGRVAEISKNGIPEGVEDLPAWLDPDGLLKPEEVDPDDVDVDEQEVANFWEDVESKIKPGNQTLASQLQAKISERTGQKFDLNFHAEHTASKELAGKLRALLKEYGFSPKELKKASEKLQQLNEMSEAADFAEQVTDHLNQGELPEGYVVAEPTDLSRQNGLRESLGADSTRRQIQIHEASIKAAAPKQNVSTPSKALGV